MKSEGGRDVRVHSEKDSPLTFLSINFSAVTIYGMLNIISFIFLFYKADCVLTQIEKLPVFLHQCLP